MAHSKSKKIMLLMCCLLILGITVNVKLIHFFMDTNTPLKETAEKNQREYVANKMDILLSQIRQTKKVINH